MLDDDDVSAFDAALAAAPALPVAFVPFALDALVGVRESAHRFTDELATLGSRELKAVLGTRVLWWTDPAAGLPGLVLASDGVDPPNLFNQLLGVSDADAPQPLLFGYDG